LLHVLEAAHELLIRAARNWVTGRSMLTEPTVVRDYLRVHFAGADVESFAAVFLDARLRVIAVEELSRGTLSQATVYPREIVRRSMRHNAACLIVAHCHPSGDLEPSPADIHLTATLRSVLALIDVRLLDHVIVCGQRTLSLAERGQV
jgi:DNA repair protein RadC